MAVFPCPLKLLELHTDNEDERDDTAGELSRGSDPGGGGLGRAEEMTPKGTLTSDVGLSSEATGSSELAWCRWIRGCPLMRWGRFVDTWKWETTPCRRSVSSVTAHHTERASSHTQIVVNPNAAIIAINSDAQHRGKVLGAVGLCINHGDVVIDAGLIDCAPSVPTGVAPPPSRLASPGGYCLLSVVISSGASPTDLRHVIQGPRVDEVYAGRLDVADVSSSEHCSSGCRDAGDLNVPDLYRTVLPSLCCSAAMVRMARAAA